MPTPPLFSSVFCTACDITCVCPGIVSAREYIFLHNFSFYKNPHSFLSVYRYRELIPASSLIYFYIKKGHLPKFCQCPYYISLKSYIHIVIEVIGISSVLTSFPYMIWKQWQPADMVRHSDFSPFWLCVPAFQQVCL